MLQSKQRLLELNAKLAETLTSKGVAATADETTTSLINKVSDISSGGGDGVLASLIERSVESVVFPDGVTSIGNYAFSSCSRLVSITIPNSVKRIDYNAFYLCRSLTSITIPNSVEYVNNDAFNSCTALKEINLEDGFNANLKISASTLIERETMINMFNALYDRTGLKEYTITINKVVGDKLTDEDKAIATVKNWTIVEQ